MMLKKYFDLLFFCDYLLFQLMQTRFFLYSNFKKKKKYLKAEQLKKNKDDDVNYLNIENLATLNEICKEDPVLRIERQIKRSQDHIGRKSPKVEENDKIIFKSDDVI